MSLAYIKGMIYDEFKRSGERGPMFELADIGQGQIMIFTPHPTEEEVERFSGIGQIELGLFYYRNQILLTFKTDRTICMDMAYAPQLSSIVPLEDLNVYPDPDSGLVVNLMLIDSISGELKDVQVFATDVQFHRSFAKALRDKLDTAYSWADDIRTLQMIYQIYPTSEKLAKAADYVFRLKEKSRLCESASAE